MKTEKYYKAGNLTAGRRMKMKLLYNGEKIGQITTNKSLTLEECFELLNLDIYEMEDENTPKWDYELFSMEY